jgi:hypothetical protein
MPIVKGGVDSSAFQTFGDFMLNCCGQISVDDSDNVVWLKTHFSGSLTRAIELLVTTKAQRSSF